MGLQVKQTEKLKKNYFQICSTLLRHECVFITQDCFFNFNELLSMRVLPSLRNTYNPSLQIQQLLAIFMTSRGNRMQDLSIMQEAGSFECSFVSDCKNQEEREDHEKPPISSNFLKDTQPITKARLTDHTRISGELQNHTNQ